MSNPNTLGKSKNERAEQEANGLTLHHHLLTFIVALKLIGDKRRPLPSNLIGFFIRQIFGLFDFVSKTT